MHLCIVESPALANSINRGFYVPQRSETPVVTISLTCKLEIALVRLSEVTGCLMDNVIASAAGANSLWRRGCCFYDTRTKLGSVLILFLMLCHLPSSDEPVIKVLLCEYIYYKTFIFLVPFLVTSQFFYYEQQKSYQQCQLTI